MMIILVINSEGKRKLERSRWNYITKKDRKEIRYPKPQMHVSVCMKVCYTNHTPSTCFGH